MKTKQLFKILNLFFCLIALLMLSGYVNAEIYLGTCEGYIRNTETQVVSDARVVMTVNSCSSGCSQETTSESTGYYLSANLNLPKLGIINVYAEKNTALGLEYGIASGTANEFQAAKVDVIICLPPPEPTLVNEPNSHSTSAVLEWTSYADKKKYPVYDEFQMDSRTIVKSNNFGAKSQDVTNLNFSSHTWRVRTCNDYCCSRWISNSFSLGNSPPSNPVLQSQPDTIPETLILGWTSGLDPDRDATYDEYEFEILNGNTRKVTNAISPQNEEVFGCKYYMWRVKTCEKESQHLCSGWSENGFFACGISCPECTTTPTTTAACPTAETTTGMIIAINENECLSISNTSYILSALAPESVTGNKNFNLKVHFSTITDLKDIIFKVKSDSFKFNDFIISNIVRKRAEFNMDGKSNLGLKPGVYNLSLEVFVKGGKIISEPMQIRVKGSNLWIYILLIVIAISIGVYIYIKKRNRQKYEYR